MLSQESAAIFVDRMSRLQISLYLKLGRPTGQEREPPADKFTIYDVLWHPTIFHSVDMTTINHCISQYFDIQSYCKLTISQCTELAFHLNIKIKIALKAYMCKFWQIYIVFVLFFISHVHLDQWKWEKYNHSKNLRASKITPTQENYYSISHLLGTVTTQWLPLWWCSHCSLVPDTVTTRQWLHWTHMLLGRPISYHGAYVEICLLGT